MQLPGQLQITADNMKIVVDYAISVVTDVALALVNRVDQS